MRHVCSCWRICVLCLMLPVSSYPLRSGRVPQDPQVIWWSSFPGNQANQSKPWHPLKSGRMPPQAVVNVWDSTLHREIKNSISSYLLLMVMLLDKCRTILIPVLVFVFEVLRFDNNQNISQQYDVFLGFWFELKFLRGTSAFSILILNIDLGLMKNPSLSSWSIEGVLYSGSVISPHELEDCSKGKCASMRFSFTTFQNWPFTTAHSSYMSLLVATG